MRNCPVCWATEYSCLHCQQFVAGPLGPGYDVVVCGRCGAGFADGIPEQEELDHYYAEQSKYEYGHSGGAESPYDLRRFEAIAQQVDPYLPSRSASILDVGCATGGLLSRFKDIGFTHLMGADPSADCVASVQTLHGICAVRAAIGELDVWSERFDLILLVGVLEHLREVGQAVSTVRRLLKPEGMLYCAQPDVESFCACTREPYQQFSTEHVNFFSRRTLDNLFATAGMEPVHGWRWMVEWREGVTDSVVSGLYRPTSRKLSWERDPTTEPALRAYLVQSGEREAAELQPRLEAIVRNGSPILVWGAGTLTRRLLATTMLARANIVGFVDSNPHLRGAQLEGRPILGPEEIAGRTEAILIGSFAFEKEIIDQIRNRLGMKNRLISLSRDEG